MSKETSTSQDQAAKPSCCVPSAQRTTSLPPDKTQPSSPSTPEDTIALPGGAFLMGSDSAEAFADDAEGPVRTVVISPFAIDRSTVTNRRFERFVRETGYVTEAERFGWSFVFWMQLPARRLHEFVVDTVAAAPWWCQVPGASWRQPAGPGSNIEDLATHPVVHVSWNDALAYCAWSGQRLPTEAEWEYAARGGLVQKRYAWGDTLRPDGRHMCNIWQGDFPRTNTEEDGYAFTCPVDAFPPNDFGLLSMTGNTWEWCSDWFGAAAPAEALSDPPGPPTGTDKVIKGGSFLCHASYCNRYRVAARSHSSPDSSTSHMSFRCVS